MDENDQYLQAIAEKYFTKLEQFRRRTADIVSEESREHNQRQNDERIARLESSVENIHESVDDIRSDLKSIQIMLSRSKETNWSVILSGVVVIGSLYASAIKPLQNDIERQNQSSSILAHSLIEKESKIDIVDNRIIKAESDINKLEEDISDIKIHGSPTTDKRLFLVEYKLGLRSRSE